MSPKVNSDLPVPTRPTGTVTLLFSDVEGSTERWERARDAMSVALARHDALVRRAIETRGGYVFKTVGDAFCAAFATAPNAIAAALDAQRALVAEDFSGVDGVRVRMALHTGHADERDGDYFGPVVNRVARLLAIAHGGQILVSGATADLVQDDLPPNSSLHDLGQHRLKDLARPENVSQLVAPDLPEAFPALSSLDAMRNNLPAQLTSFVGRENDLREIETLLSQHRLVTLVGAGGVGKTRAAIQVGADLLDGSGDGVWLVELALIEDASLVAGAIARALNVQESPRRPLLETLIAFLKNKRMLLVLDNCEHVIDSARSTATAILRDCPDVRILATSRETLHVAGEHAWRIPSLSVPPSGPISASQQMEFAAAALFVDRARASDDRFELTDENAVDVGSICRQLDGIPLAIELAAARVKILTPRQIVQMLHERFRILTGGDRTALPRQQTMRALIDWSYDLLSEQEQRLFRQLAIFAGGFTMESARAVCADVAIDELAVLELLSSLVDKSLVHAELAATTTRYRLLESTRQYAREKLNDRNEYAATARSHAAAYLDLAEKLERTWALDDRAWIAQAEPEMENWRAALTWAFGGGGGVELGQRLAGELRKVWSSLGAPEGRRWVQAALETVVPETPPGVVAKLDLAQAQMAGALIQYKLAYDAAERAIDRYRSLDEPLGTIEAQYAAGSALVFLGRIVDGEALLGTALLDARALAAHRTSGVLVQALAIARQLDGDLAGARPLFAEALVIFKEVGADRQIATVSADLAELEFQRGDLPAALQLAREAVATLRAHNDVRRVALQLANMAAYLLALGRYDEARAHAREALVAAGETQGDVFVVFALQHLAAVAALKPGEDRARAARLLGFADGRLNALEAQREYTELQEYDRMLLAMHDAFAPDELTKLMDEGRGWSEARAISEAMLI